MKILETPSEPFATACALAEIPPTSRQWRKWKRGMGLAAMFIAEALEKLRAQEDK